MKDRNKTRRVKGAFVCAKGSNEKRRCGEKMANLSELITRIAGRVDSFMKQRTVIAVLMLYEGVMLLIYPGDATKGMATGIAVAIALAAGGIIAEALAKQGGKKQAILPALLGIGLAVYIYFQPDFFVGILRYLIAGSVLMTGLLNLAQAFGISVIRKQGEEAGKGAPAPETQGEGGGMRAVIRKTLKSETDRRLKPTQNLFSRMGKSIVSVWITGIVMTALGIFLFFQSVEGDWLLSVISGILMIITSLSDLVAAYKMKQALKKEQASPDAPDAGTPADDSQKEPTEEDEC